MTRSDPIHVPLEGPLTETRFVERPNRFLLRCELPRGATRGPQGGGVVEVHLADPGRLEELLIPGRRVWIRWAASPTRKTDWSAVLVETPDGQGLVSVDTTMPNKLIHRALAEDALKEFDGWSLDRAEFPLGASRIDFLLTGGDAPGSAGGTTDGSDRVAERAEGYGPQRKLALEVKSVTLVEDEVALFPDAVTARGARHVRELAEVAGRIDDDGAAWSAAILFVLQRDDAHRIEAARSIDPDFADALAEAKAAGVRILGRRCRVTKDRLELGDPVPAT
ncbi:MAG: DNA/RNA nuclease SfsA [Longimicrobiales bacterium]|nr:DNA/RNA nuclease SfsA [Longimicrobiales bacterium]